jgi:hypothetical protein
MIRELCRASALAVDRIAKENGMDGYQTPIARLYIEVFKQTLDKMEGEK